MISFAFFLNQTFQFCQLLCQFTNLIIGSALFLWSLTAKVQIFQPSWSHSFDCHVGYWFILIRFRLALTQDIYFVRSFHVWCNKMVTVTRSYTLVKNICVLGSFGIEFKRWVQWLLKNLFSIIFKTLVSIKILYYFIFCTLSIHFDLLIINLAWLSIINSNGEVLTAWK